MEYFEQPMIFPLLFFIFPFLVQHVYGQPLTDFLGEEKVFFPVVAVIKSILAFEIIISVIFSCFFFFIRFVSSFWQISLFLSDFLHRSRFTSVVTLLHRRCC